MHACMYLLTPIKSDISTCRYINIHVFKAYMFLYTYFIMRFVFHGSALVVKLYSSLGYSRLRRELEVCLAESEARPTPALVNLPSFTLLTTVHTSWLCWQSLRESSHGQSYLNSTVQHYHWFLSHLVHLQSAGAWWADERLDLDRQLACFPRVSF